MSEQPPVIKKIKSTGPMRQLMGEYFKELDEAAKTGRDKVAWCTSVGPAELLRSFGFKVYFPENHGALLGSSRMAADLIPVANAVGYSPDICSYLTSDIGSYISKKTPLTRAFGMEQVPRADVLVYNTNQCRDVQDWFAFYQREFGVPSIGIETPRSLGELTDSIVQGLIGQYRALVPVLEEISGRKLDMERLKEVTASSYRCTLLWKKVLRLAERRPSPLTFFDGTIHMGPAVVLRGDERAERYYELLIAELEERIAEGVGAVNDESHRFYWEGMPVWGKLRENAETFAGHKACVVASTYCNSWIFEDLAHEDPFEGMARAYAELFIVRSEGFKERYLESMVHDYGINGFIYHDAKTCPNNSNNRYGLPVRVREKSGVPYVVINGDLNDLRLYSEEQARTQFEALVEQLQERMTVPLYCGADVGASATKLVLVDSAGDVVGRAVRRSGVDYSATAKSCLDEALEQAGADRSAIARNVSTGYGRHNVDFRDSSLTEIHCHGIGCYHHFRRAMTIIDIGGQDNKVIRLTETGQRVDFKMNRKCAAGTGAFLEEMALRLAITPSEMNALAEEASEAARLNSFCTVFAKTEILAHLRQGVKVTSLVRGAFLSVINRVTEMDVLEGEVVLSGGVVAHNPVIAAILSDQLGKKVLVPPHPQFAGALGAALTALKQAESSE